VAIAAPGAFKVLRITEDGDLKMLQHELDARVKRLNWGCGSWVEAGWVNSDLKPGAGVIVADIREGLPFASDSFDYVVSIHALPELEYSALLPALEELRRVVKTDGPLRLGLPDLERSVDAYRRGDRSYFQISDEEMQTLGGKLATQLVWYGYSRTVFLPEFVEELLLKAGFHCVDHVEYGETRSEYPEIVSLDNRRRESFFVEARK
jgi:SAM-dependent methyltransferase